MSIDMENGALTPYRSVLKFKKGVGPVLRVITTDSVEFPMEAAISVPSKERSEMIGEITQRLFDSSEKLLIQGGDITIIMYHYVEGREKVYWREDRTEDRRVDILLQKPGLYIIEFDNTYSWVKGKKVLYKIEQFGKCSNECRASSTRSAPLSNFWYCSTSRFSLI